MAILLADIGGTNARFYLYKKGKLVPLIEDSCDGFKTAYDVIEEALKNCPKPLTGMVIAGAGPVVKGALKWTNRSGWKVSENELKKRYLLRKVLVVNDLQAQGEGVKMLYKSTKTSVLMTAGTGLGACFIVAGQVIPGEVGQIQTDEGLKVEESVSGPGIVRLYHYLGGNKQIKSARKIAEMCNQKDKIALKTFTVFYQKWGKVAARLVTALYATGGVYLYGGLIPKTACDKKIFTTSYKNTLPGALKNVPVRLVKEKALTFKGLVSLLRREFGQS